MTIQSIFYFPKGTPQAIVTKMADAMEKAVNTDAYKKAVSDAGGSFVFQRGDALKAAIAQDNEKVAAIAADLRGEK